MFQFDSSHIERLLRTSLISIDKRYLLFAIRGCLPVNLQDIDWSPSKPLRQVPVDYRRLRCTVGLVDLEAKLLMACPASTVPRLDYVTQSARMEGEGTNQLMPGLLRFKQGQHPRAGGDRSHVAFLQDMPFPFQRTRDDVDYDDDDLILVESPGDNLHAAYVDSIGVEVPDKFESRGCIVVAGYPKRVGMPESRDIGCWPRFRDAAYATEARSLDMLLCLGSEAEAAAMAQPGSIPVRLRYGSAGPLVKQVQSELERRGLLALANGPSGKYQFETMRAVKELQRRERLSADATCGLYTADALGIENWPRV